MAINAIAHIRGMRGCSQPHLMRADDGHLYIVKFLNNAQHRRVLTNEWLAFRLASALGLPIPPAVQIEVPEALVASCPDLVIQKAGFIFPCTSGLNFGSRMPTVSLGRVLHDRLPTGNLTNVENLPDFAGMLVLDTWLCNCDTRQVVCFRPKSGKKFRAYMIDNGACFDTEHWRFPDSCLRGIYPVAGVYSGITGWGSFEPWLTAVEDFDALAIRALASEVPHSWCAERCELEALLDTIAGRRSKVRRLLWSIKTSTSSPFQHWSTGTRLTAVA